jgi:hypothetical protein
LALFVGWVLAPFLALAWCQPAAKRRSELTPVALHAVTLVLTLGSALIYGYIAFGPPRTKPAFFFLVVPFLSLVVVAFVVAMCAKKNAKANEGG